jgi:hypothetical protein
MWMLYYVEIVPILYFLVAQQIGRLLHRVGGAANSAQWPVPVTNAALATALVLVPLGTSDVIRTHAAIDLRNSFHRTARSSIESRTPPNAIVFVRYDANHSPHLAITGNSANAAAGRWLVYDRGVDENRRLLSLAPERPPFVFDTASLDVVALAPARAHQGTVSIRSQSQ